ncbi:MAG TPA: transposase, partial [Candidatus Aerophobetes bacterium]|nr:transposase [Candidatus Aerophobetes bacterium]
MAKSRKDKSSILDEYCKNTHQNRKYAIRRIRSFSSVPKERRKRKQTYDGYVKVALAKLWEIFDYPCGQRLAPLLKTETSRLRQLEEIFISSEVVQKLATISPATIDRKLKHQREVLHLNRKRGGVKPASLLYKKVPIRLTEWDTSELGFLEIDLVIHCGSSPLGLYICSLNTVEISSGWWEAEAIMGKGQDPTFKALKGIRKRTPFEWKGIDSDNGPEFINHHLINYCEKENLEFTRSRPNKKNDNAYIEQKNWTHVRKVFGYFRYDTDEELILMNSLYEKELRLYKNFFSPVMKLTRKERVGGRVKRKYDVPKTPYQR